MSLGQTTSAPASAWLTAVPREELERRVVHDLAVGDEPAVAVVGVLAQAHVGHEHELGQLGPQRAQRLLHDAVLRVGAGAGVVLFLGDPEEEHRADPEPVHARTPRRPARRPSGARSRSARAAARRRPRRDRRRADSTRLEGSSRVSRTSERSGAVRRKRRSRDDRKCGHAESVRGQSADAQTQHVDRRRSRARSVFGPGASTGEPCLAELALDVELDREAPAAVRVRDTRWRLPTTRSRRGTWPMFASEPHGSPASKSAAAFQRTRSAASTAMCARGDRELDALVRADRPAEDLALRRVRRGLLHEPAPSPIALAGDEHAARRSGRRAGSGNPGPPRRRGRRRAPRRRPGRPRSCGGSSSSGAAGSS